jgi:excisionase family DNA binding protein
MRRENEQDVFVSDVTFVGRHKHDGAACNDRGEGSSYPGDNYGEKKTWLTLQEAATRAGTSVEEVKRLVREGELPAERRGHVRIHLGDLMDWLHRP